MIEIKNGVIVLEKETVMNHSILIKEGLIYDIVEKDKVDYSLVTETIDAKNSFVLPGFIDIHSDYIEQAAAPRATSTINFDIAMKELEKELISHGITTMFHSISLLKNYGKKILRKSENVAKISDLIEKSRKNPHIINNKFHLRFELDNIDAYQEVIDFVESGKVDLLSFMDHTPGQGQYRDIEMYKISYIVDEGLTEEQVNAYINKLKQTPKLTYDKIKKIADIAYERGIAIASHDDDSVEKLDVAASLHTCISEFPLSLEVAKDAKERGMHTVAGAPNVLIGKSHNGNLSAREAVKNDVVDVLCSDYYPSSLLHAVFTLYELGHDLSKAVNCVTINPARAVGMGDETGSIEKGKKADLIIVKRLPDNIPFITHGFVNGTMVFRMENRI